MAKRKAGKRAPKQPKRKRGPLPLLPITISASIVWLPMEAMRMGLFGDSEERRQWLMNALIDAHNKYHAPMIRQAEAQQASSRRGTQVSKNVRQAKAADTDQQLAALVCKMLADGKMKKEIWNAAVREGLADSANGARQRFYRIQQAQRGQANRPRE